MRTEKKHNSFGKTKLDAIKADEKDGLIEPIFLT